MSSNEDGEGKYVSCGTCMRKIIPNINNGYKGKHYCPRCFASTVAYESDVLRKGYDITQIPDNELTWYQLAHKRRIIEYKEQMESVEAYYSYNEIQ